MKTFLVTYNSEGNMFSGKLAINAEKVSDAQTMFLDWLQEQPTYQHLWRLEFSFEEIKGVLG